MADSATQDPPSPVSVLLQTLGMTRDDLMRHAAQMKSFLETEQNSLRALTNQNEAAALQEVKTRPATHSRRSSLSNNASAPLRTASPPVTPVKAEPVERAIPRQMDTMEMIMERKDRQRRKERRASASRSKDSRRVELPEITTPSTPQTSMGTPHHYRYYSERVMEEASGSKSSSDPFILNDAYLETPTRKTPRARPPVFKAPQTPSRFPKTPTSRQPFLLEPPSSYPSSPMSSPARIVNLVSSPGPMRAVPQVEEDPDDLPYILPSGPYSREKPDFSYAAIIGQAILSSPERRLALQDIYEWITTVYPYYQRGEQTWMNSIRHALSTMAVFRKVPRVRMEGKSLWAIFDHDLPCFAGGGFRKSLCADMMKLKGEASKPGPKKRGTMEEAISRNAKRRKTTSTGHDFYGNPVPPLMSGPFMQPFYPQFLPGTHHQPYYGTYVTAQPLPAEVVFPPLPPSSNYHQLVTMQAAEASSSSKSDSVSATSAASSSSVSSYAYSIHEPSPAPSSSVTSASVPDLSSDDGSSSSPPLPAAQANTQANTITPSAPLPPHDEPTIADPDAAFEKWLAADPDPSEDAVAPHLTLLRGFSEGKISPERMLASTARKRNGKMSALPIPTSPTVERRSAAKQKAAARTSPNALTSLLSQRSSSSRELTRSTTPPRRPCTPTRKPLSTLSPQSSPQRTPLSYSRSRTGKSPSPHRETGSSSMPSPELMRTPSRKRITSSGGPSSGSGHNKSPNALFSMSPFAPVTPRRLLFHNDYGSPFRTPQSARRLLDPHDPATLLDDELARLNSQHTQGSPSGLYGRAGKGLLYESPSMPSPGMWDRHW